MEEPRGGRPRPCNRASDARRKVGLEVLQGWLRVFRFRDPVI